MKNLLFNKDKLGAFIDAILAIIMTILVLELGKPSEPTVAAFLSMWHSYAAYAISFFWLGSMWTALHIAWDRIDQISQKTVWISIALMFWASFVPYVTSLLIDWSDKRTVQGIYGAVIIFTTLHLLWLYGSLKRDNQKEDVSRYITFAEKSLRFDLVIKVAGFIVAVTVYPPGAEIGVLVAAVYTMGGRLFFGHHFEG